MIQKINERLYQIYSREYKVYSFCNLFYFIYIHNNKLLNSLRHWGIHFPSAANSFLIGLTCTSRACCNSHYLKPWMIL